MTDVACDIAHGEVSAELSDRRLVVVYANPLAQFLLHWGAELGFSTTLLEPDGDRRDQAIGRLADAIATTPVEVAVDQHTDVVFSDHHRDDLGPLMSEMLKAQPRWIGIIGSPRHDGPHVAALQAEGVAEEQIRTVQRPIGVDIGSKTPPEIALSILAGLLADRHGRPAG
ncbi:MAG: XdhC family protein, partial [Nitriliruptoraceae bacterium]